MWNSIVSPVVALIIVVLQLFLVSIYEASLQTSYRNSPATIHVLRLYVAYEFIPSSMPSTDFCLRFIAFWWNRSLCFWLVKCFSVDSICLHWFCRCFWQPWIFNGWHGGNLQIKNDKTRDGVMARRMSHSNKMQEPTLSWGPLPKKVFFVVRPSRFTKMSILSFLDHANHDDKFRTEAACPVE